MIRGASQRFESAFLYGEWGQYESDTDRLFYHDQLGLTVNDENR